MLCELRVRQLGVIEDLSLVFAPGMTALTGETGAGKTLVVEALQLLLGARADPVLVKPGALEALVEGRFSVFGDEGETEVVLSRAVPADGRSRAYVDGRMATVAALLDAGQRLVDLHGQHAHQSLLSPAAQRHALDTFAGADLYPRQAAQGAVRQVQDLMAEVGGDGAARAREVEFLRYQLAELEAAGLTDADEDAVLAEEEERLAHATAHRQAAQSAYDALVGEEGAADRLGSVVGALSGHRPLEAVYHRLRGVAAEMADAGADLRALAESLEDDPARLAQVVQRRALLRELRRKYAAPGGDLAAVLAFRTGAATRLAHLEDLEGAAADLARRHEEAMADLKNACQELGRARRAAAGALGKAIEKELQRLAMPSARFGVEVGGDTGGGDLGELAGDGVTFVLAANPGGPQLPLAKVASGGELARAMLALRLVLLAQARSGDAQGPATLVFDEVDAGIGGEAALAVGQSLSQLAQSYQVIVVTHLAQVAAYAEHQVAVRKEPRGGTTVAQASLVSGEERVIELSRMLSGQPHSGTARRHASELLTAAAGARGGNGPPPFSAR